MNPQDRPSAAQIYKTFSQFRSARKFVEELPGKLVLQILGVESSPNELNQQGFYVKVKHGNKVHTTSLTGKVVGGEYKWSGFACFHPRYSH